MGVRATGMVAAVVIALSGLLASAALADGPVGTDPSSNYDISSLPASCDSDPTGADCINAAIGYLDQARASLGQPAYALPRDFVSMSPVQQTFVLTNLDRMLYGLPPIPGLTARLNQDAAAGVQSDSDPQPSDPNWMAYTSNWAGGYDNVVIAYEVWMYDDGPNSDNLDCTSSNPSGCWGHRHDILWQFDGSGPLEMGAAVGQDSSGSPGYTMLIEKAASGANPVYTYTWAQAVADGAGGPGAQATGSGSPSGSTPTRTGARRGAAAPSPIAHAANALIKLGRIRVRGHRVIVAILAPNGTALKCTLSGRSRRGRHVWRSKRCGRGVSFARLPAGHYWLRVSAGTLTVARRLWVL